MCTRHFVLTRAHGSEGLESKSGGERISRSLYCLVKPTSASRVNTVVNILCGDGPWDKPFSLKGVLTDGGGFTISGLISNPNTPEGLLREGRRTYLMGYMSVLPLSESSRA